MPYHISWQRAGKKIEFYLRRVECRIGDSVFLSLHQTSLNGLKTPAAELNFTLSSFRFVELGFVW